MNKFLDKPKTHLDKVINGNRTYKMGGRFRFLSEEHGLITVPKNFITDGASIPRIFWPIMSPSGEYFEAAIIHDFLYSLCGNKYQLTRKQADDIFNEGMKELGVKPRTRLTIYWAVRICGWYPYKKK
jgi:hypothetical protein